ncbi:MAG: outer membrane beta-barrel protein [Desulfovibrio sp.]|jgi:opacity protein-like surface antigen|nr:outer membrane beta-barrel protein [Desulfovibrio sp.]
MNALGGQFAIGYDFFKKFNVPIRTEIEYGIYGNTNTKINEADVEGGMTSDEEWKLELGIQTLLLNVYYDFRNDTKFTPYVGAGLCIAFINAGYRYYNTSSTHCNDRWLSKNQINTNFAWNLGLGIAYDINDYFSIDLGYSFSGLGPVDAGSETYSYLDGTVDPELKTTTQSCKMDYLFTHQIALGVRVTF